jgi:hypothetical protein
MGVMLFDSKYEVRLGVLEGQLRRAYPFTPDLMSDVIAKACTRFAAGSSTTKVPVNHLIEAGAWNDAALALIELDLPAWKIRRLVYEDGKWLCSLSTQPNLPATLDDTADASHEVLPLAILSAFVEARSRTSAMRETSSQTVSQVRLTSGYAVCCDNFT